MGGIERIGAIGEIGGIGGIGAISGIGGIGPPDAPSIKATQFPCLSRKKPLSITQDGDLDK